MAASTFRIRRYETFLQRTSDLSDITYSQLTTYSEYNIYICRYETFLQRTSDLSDIANFPLLRGRMDGTGMALRKVVYRGYSASAQLQEMHDESITQRTPR